MNSKSGAAITQASSDLKGKSLLVAEDNPVNQLVAKALLERFGFSVTLAADGKQALELLQNQDFDAVLMDIQMPVMDGIEATACIRSMDQFAKLPVIALTAGLTQQESERCQAAGINAIVSKPINIQELTAALAKHFEN